MAGFQNGFEVLDETTYTTVSSVNDDVVLDGSLMYVTPANNNDAITGLTGGIAGARIIIVNVDPTNSLVIKHDDAGSTAENRILIYNGADVTIPPFEALELGYASTDSRWHSIKSAI